MRALLTQDELGRIEAAVREAERGTTAEIVVVVAGGTAEAGWLLGPALAALAIPMPMLLAWPRLTPGTLYTVQLAVLAAGLLLGLIPGLRRLLTPAASAGSGPAAWRATSSSSAACISRQPAPVSCCSYRPPTAAPRSSPTPGPKDRCRTRSGAAHCKRFWRKPARAASPPGSRLPSRRSVKALRARLPADQHDRNEVPDRPVLL